MNSSWSITKQCNGVTHSQLLPVLLGLSYNMEVY